MDDLLKKYLFDTRNVRVQAVRLHDTWKQAQAQQAHPACVTRLLGEAGANIVEVHHQRLFHNVPVKMAEVDVVLETRNQTHVDALIARMKDAGYPTTLMVEVG